MPAKKDSITIISESSDEHTGPSGSKEFPFAVKKLAESPQKPYAFYSV